MVSLIKGIRQEVLRSCLIIMAHEKRFTDSQRHAEANFGRNAGGIVNRPVPGLWDFSPSVYNPGRDLCRECRG